MLLQSSEPQAAPHELTPGSAPLHPRPSSQKSAVPASCETAKPTGEPPSCLQATAASSASNWSSQIGRHEPLWKTSRMFAVPRIRTSPSTAAVQPVAEQGWVD